VGAGQFPLDGSSKARDGRDHRAAERQRPQLASGPFSVLFVESGTRQGPITNARIGLLSWSPRFGCVPPNAGAILSVFSNRWRDLAAGLTLPERCICRQHARQGESVRRPQPHCDQPDRASFTFSSACSTDSALSDLTARSTHA